MPISPCPTRRSFLVSTPARRLLAGIILWTAAIAAPGASAQNAVSGSVTLQSQIALIAGGGKTAPSTSAISATAAELYGPHGVAVDGAGNVYIADTGAENVVEQVSAATGKIAVVAGGGNTAPMTASSDLLATDAKLSDSYRVAVDRAGDLYIADSGNHQVEMVAAPITSSSQIVVVVGGGNTVPNSTGISATGTTGTTGAKLSQPEGMAVDGAGNLYIVDTGYDLVEKVTAPGTPEAQIVVVAGIYNTVSPAATTATISATMVGLDAPSGVAVDGAGNLYISDTGHNLVEEVSGGDIAVVAGDSTGTTPTTTPSTATTTKLDSPHGVGWDGAGHLYISNYGNNLILQVNFAAPPSPQIVVVGGGEGTKPGTTAELATNAKLDGPADLTLDRAGNVYIADNTNGLVEKLGSFTTLPTTAIGSSSATQNVFVQASGVSTITASKTADGTAEFTVGTSYSCVSGTCTVPITFSPEYPGLRTGTLTFSSSTPSVIGTVGLYGTGTGPLGVQSPGALSVVAGNSSSTTPPTTAPTTATSVDLDSPRAVAVDGAGNFYITDQDNNLIEKVNTAGKIVVVAGNGTHTPMPTTAPDLLATNAGLFYPEGVAVDAAGNIYIADLINRQVEQVNATTGNIVVVAGGGHTTPSTTAIPATSAYIIPAGVAVDAAGNLYIADQGGFVEKVTAPGTPGAQIVVVAGGGHTTPSTKPIAATSANVMNPDGVAVDAAGNLYIADTGNFLIEQVSAATGQLVVVAGSSSDGTVPGATPIAATSAQLSNPSNVVVDAAGDLYIADGPSNNQIEQVSGGYIVVVAGSGGATPSTTAISATSAQLSAPTGVAVDGAGSLYITDGGNNFVEKDSTALPGLTLNFPATNVDGSSAQQAATFENIGNTTLSVSALAPDSGDNFNLSGAATTCATAPFTLTLGAGCNLGIVFAPTASGPISGYIKITDNTQNGTSVAQKISLSGTGNLVVTPATLPAGTVGIAYRRTISASGGTASYSYTATGLPDGLSLNSSTGVLSGTPTEGGSFSVTITATDSSTPTALTGSNDYTLTINAGTIRVSPTILPEPTVGVAYNRTITASGGTSPYTYAVTTGALPTGLSLDTTTGVLSGTPTAGGTFHFTVTATDSSGGSGPYTGHRAYTLTVSRAEIALTPTDATLPRGRVGAAYSEAVTASGGTAPYTYTETGTLPAGVTLSSTTGLLSGTPTEAGAFHFTVKATDSSTGTGAPYTASRAYTLTIGEATIVLMPTNATLPMGKVGVAYSEAVTASGGTAPYTYTETGTLPAGVTLSSTTGLLSGTPTEAGAFHFTVKATDSSTGTGAPYSASRAYTLTISEATIVLMPTHATLPMGKVGVAYSEAVTASGGTAPYTYTETGTLPAGVTLSSTTGLLSGTPTEAGAFHFTIKATDSSTGTGAPYSASRAYTLTIGAATIVLMPTTLPAGKVGVAYSQAVTASGGTAPYTYTETGTLPAGVTLSSSTGLLSGTPTSAGTFHFTVRVTDSSTGFGAPFTASHAYTLTIGAATITLSPTTLPVGKVGVAYSQAVTAAGGTAPYTYTETGALPAGVTLNSTTGLLSGTPTAAGTFHFTVRATDHSTGIGAPFTASHAYTLTIGAAMITLSPATLPAATLDDAYSTTIAASGGTAPYTYRVTSGALPAGLSLNTTTGLLSGTPTATGMSHFTITATDHSTGPGSPFTGSHPYTLTVGTITVTPAALPAGTAGVAYSQTIAASGGVSPYTYNVTSGALPGGLSLNTATGLLSGTPTAAGTFNFSVTAKDSSTGTAVQPYALTINQGTATVTLGSLTQTYTGSPLSVTATTNPTGLTVNFTYNSSATPPTAAGSYTVVGTISSTSYTGSATGQFVIQKAVLTVSANNATKVYGTANPTFTGSVTGQQGSDSFTESFSTTATIASPVTTYAITPSVTGANLADYTQTVHNGTLTITQAASVSALSVSSAAPALGQSVTLTAQVTSTTSETPTGTVSFYDGSTLLDTATLSPMGTAAYSTTALSAGSHSLSVQYGGDTNFTGSSSSAAPTVVTVAATPLDFTLVLGTGNTTSVAPGGTATYNLNITPTGGAFPGTVAFSLTGLPTQATYAFNPATLAANSPGGAVVLTVTIPRTDAAAGQGPYRGGREIPIAFGLLLLPLAGARRLRKTGHKLGGYLCLWLLLVLGGGAMAGMMGCGVSNQPQGYTLTITATSGSVQHSTTATLSVQ